MHPAVIFFLITVSFLAFTISGSELNKHIRKLGVSGPLYAASIQDKINRDRIIMLIAFISLFIIAFTSTLSASTPCPR